MDAIEVFKNINYKHVLLGLAVLLIGVVLCICINKIRDVLLSKVQDTEETGIRKKAFISTATNGLKLFIVVFSLLTVMQINGINVSSLLTGLGILSAVTGLAAQDIAKDFVQGLRIASEGFFQAGDYIRYGGKDCQVIEFGMLSTKLVDLSTNDPVFVCNRNITEVTRMSGKEYITIKLPYNISPEESEKFMQDAMKDVYAIKGVKACKYLGLKEMGASTADHLVMITCNPKQARQMIRNTKMVFFKLMNENGIEVPYDKLEIIDENEKSADIK